MAVKIPQIIKILRSFSVEGLTYMATILELGAVTFASCYNYSKSFPLSTWAENLLIAIQVVVILLLMALIKHHSLIFVIALSFYSVGVLYLVSGLAPMGLLTTLQGLVIPLVLSSRVTTIYTIYSNGSTGQLAFITAFLNFLGTAGRVFTTLQETKDTLLLVSFIASFAVNTIILLQFLWYWNVATPIKKKD
jgi:mannose-P-dolichol utilization defect protein 1